MRFELVHQMFEGLRGKAFMLARDLRLEKLTQEDGIKTSVCNKEARIPWASEESGELFTVGQRISGPLSRQPSESRGSYMNGGRRWWTTLHLTYCRSLNDHWNADIPATEGDKQLQIELSSIRQSLFQDDGSQSTDVFPECGDGFWWIETSTMIADARTKSTKPSFLFHLPSDGVYQVRKGKQRNK